MADDVPPASGCTNPGCIELKKKHSELKETKKAFRDGVKLLNKKLEEAFAENANLKQAYERMRTDLEQEKQKENSIRHGLEKELHKLKEDISLHQKYKDEVESLEALVLEKEIEMSEIKECLEKENCDSEKKKAKAEKRKAERAQKLLNVQKDKAEEGRKRAENECKLMEARILEREAEIKRITELLEKEKTKAKAEKEKTPETQKLLIIAKNKAEEERRRAETECKLIEARISEREEEIKRITKLLEKEKTKANAEKDKTAEAQRLLLMEKNKAEEAGRHAESERKKAEDSRISLERSKCEINELRGKLVLEKSRADNAKQQVDTEKQKTCREMKHADLQRIEAEEQRKLIEIERKKTLEEKVHADCLSQHLEMEKQRNEALQKKIEILSAQRGEGFSCKNSENADIKLLKEKLKLEKKRVRYAERLARLETAEKGFIGQQVSLLKQELIQLSHRLKILDGCLSYNTECKEGPTKITESPERMDFNLHDKFLGVRQYNFDSRSNHGHTQSYNGLVNYPVPTKECTGLRMSGGSFTRPIPGISSELESPVWDSIRNKSQSSAVCSATTNFSDRTFMDSHEGDDLFMTTAAKYKRSYLKHRSAVPILSCEVANIKQNEDNRVAAQSIDGHAHLDAVTMHLNSFAQDGTEAVSDEISRHPIKKRRIQETLECITRLYSEENQLRLKMDGELSALKNLVSSKHSLTQAVCSPTYKISNCPADGREILTKKHDSLSKYNYRCGKDSPEDEQQNQHESDIFEDEGVMEPCFLDGTAEPNNQTLENVDPVREESLNAVGSDQVPLPFFENLACGDYLKLLELDNEEDERRYRLAMESPISPTLPIIESPRVQLYDDDESHRLVEGQPRCRESGRDSSVSSCSFDVIDLEIKSNMVKLKTSNERGVLSEIIRVFGHAYEEPKSCSGQISYSVSKHNGKHYGVDLNPHVGNHKLNVEKISDTRHSSALLTGADLLLFNPEPKTSLRQGKPLIQGLPNENTANNRNSCNDDISGKKNKYFAITHVLSNSLGGSKHSSEVPENNDQVRNSGLVKRRFEYQEQEVNDTVVAKCLKHYPQEIGMKKSIDDGKSISAASQPTQTSFHHISDSSAIIKAGHQVSVPLKTNTILEDFDKSDKRFKSISKYCIVFSDNKDENSISRIIQARNTLAYQNIMANPVLFITEILHALKLMTDLLPEEKVSVLFSLLVPNFLVTTSGNSESINTGDIFCYAESFASKLTGAVTEEIKWAFQEICKIDILLKLIEDFLINRELLVYNDSQREKLSASVSSSNIFRLEGGSTSLFCSAAKPDQLVTAGFILACFCDAFGRMDFLLEASYKILRICRNDTSWILLVLHIFYSAVGDKLFLTRSYGFVTDAIKSLVLLLETRHQLSNVSPFSLSSDKGPNFSPCEKCAFRTNALPADKFTSLLLNLLQDCVSGVRQQDLSKTILNSVHSIAILAEQGEGHTGMTYEFDGNIECDESCMISKYMKNGTNRPNFTSERSFCHYTDVVSLMELIGCYMSWEWTCTNIIPRLLELMEQCVHEEFSAALVVLIGQLGRFGVDAGGYGQSGVVKLRCTLSRFLDTVISSKGCFLTQVTVVGALVNLLPLSYEEIVGDMKHSLDTSQSSHARLIKEWFSQLSRELKSLTVSLFIHTDVQKF